MRFAEFEIRSLPMQVVVVPLPASRGVVGGAKKPADVGHGFKVRIESLKF